MKTLIISLLMFVFAATNIINAQEGDHLTFKNVPITGSLDEFVTKMKAAGFTLKELDNNTATMEGRFVNRDCELYVIGSPKSKRVWKATVYLPKETSWISIKSSYNDFKEQFTTKYGKPSSSYNFFSEPYYEGDGYEMQALRKEKCHYISFWETRTGNIAVSISKYEQIKFVYEDRINSSIDTAEKESNIQDDI